MASTKKLDIKFMVTYPVLLEKAIQNHNKFKGTDFEIVETIFDQVPYCRMVADNYSEKDLFSLGYKLAIFEQKFNQDNNRK
ncbi:hypothetical protein [Flagellimonas crocea]|uniref:hypothetical protein n=1 Tax=Flagellimonas crocea TaxID=3067311 RepID=UPI0029700177|nr:hypothetical protein [Muricauda sp. DH64]